jgi:hypothetical protein
MAKRLLEIMSILFPAHFQGLVGDVVSSAKLHVPQKYHLDISNIQHHLNVEVSAISVSVSMRKCHFLLAG